MSIQGNLHGYTAKALLIAREAKGLVEQERYEEIDGAGIMGQLYRRLCNIELLLQAIEQLDEEEVKVLKRLARQEHDEGEELHQLLSGN